MAGSVYAELEALAAREDNLERTVAYVAEHMGQFIKQNDRVLICFPKLKAGDLAHVMEAAVHRCGGIPVFWGPDFRWKTLLQQAFFSKARVIVGPPLVILGLTKLKRQRGIPLYIRHAVTAGYPCLQWMVDGIRQGFDCSVWGSLGMEATGVVAGFSCPDGRGVHLRQDTFRVEVVDSNGSALPEGQSGEIVISSLEKPELRFAMVDQGRLERTACLCGDISPRLMDIEPGPSVDKELAKLGIEMQSWTSILDCRIARSDYGLELELVVFPGEKLPKLPPVARLLVRAWDPNRDEPIFYAPMRNNQNFY